MKFGIMYANAGPFGLPDHLENLVQSAEAAGFESIWTVEHVVVPVGYESQYPYSESGKLPGGRGCRSRTHCCRWPMRLRSATS